MAFCVYCGNPGEGRFCGNCGEPQPSLETKSKKPKSPRFAIFITATFSALALLGSVFVVKQYIAPFEGPLKLQVRNDMGQNSLKTDLYSLRVNGSIVQIPSVGKSVELESDWESDSAISVNLTTDVAGERDLNFSIVPRDLGLLGSDAGKSLIVVVSVEEDQFEVELHSGSTQQRVVLASRRSPRVNYDKLLAACTSGLTQEVSSELRYASGVYSKYLEAVKEARLDGSRSLLYTTWASRSRNLQGLIRDIRLGAPIFSGEVGFENWSLMIESLRDMETAWQNLESVARAESDSRWDAAWNQIYSKERDLSSNSRGVSRITSLIKDACIDRLTN